LAAGLIVGWMIAAGAGGTAGDASESTPDLSPQAFTIALDPGSVSPGGTLTVVWGAPSGRPATDWVGVFPQGGGPGSEVWWVYTGSATSGSVTLQAPGTSGVYEARYLLEDGYAVAAISAATTVGGSSPPPPPSTGFSVTTSPSSAAPGQLLTVAWTAPGGRAATDWVGLFPSGGPAGSEVWWTYTGGSPTGSARLAAPGVGTYEVRYLLQDGYQVGATGAAPVTVTSSSPPPATPGDIVRFLEQSTFGPTPGLIAHVQNVGFETFLEEQFNAPISSYPTLPLYPTTRDLTACPNNSTCQRDNYTMYPLQNRFFVNALYGPDQLRQRVALALHQIVVVSGVDVNQPSWMAPYLQLLDRNAFGNFRQLLFEISLSPAMGRYLDISGNTRTNPNENYAREILQLFSIGTVLLNPDGTQQIDGNGQPIPAYTQTDVNNFSRVFTGWRLAAAPAAGVPNYIDNMTANQAQHDIGEKTLLNGAVLPAGQTALQDLNGAIDNIFNHPNVGPFISKHLIQHLVTSNPSSAYVARTTAVFNDNGSGQRGDLRALVRAILLDEEARGDIKTDPVYGRLRNPAQFVANILRAFNARGANGTGQSDGYLNPRISPMGMDLFRPQSVFSYFAPGTVVPGTSGVRGPEFGILSTSTALQRANFVNTIVFSTIPVSANAPTGTSIDLSPLQALAGNPAELVEYLNQLLMHGAMPDTMRQSVIHVVSAVSATNTLKRARTAVYLVATSSQYQVER
jgi:hypothetical protein